MELGQDYYDKALEFDQSKNYRQAFIYFSVAAEMGHGAAENYVGFYYLNGYGVEKDDVKAVEWFRKATGHSNMFGAYNLAYCYESGRGVEQNAQKAFESYLRSAELGYADAQNVAGNCYHNGYGVAVNYNKAVEWYRKAAAQNQMNGFYNLGWCYEQGHGVEQDPQKAFENYLRSAELGNVDGQNAAGNCYHNGYGVAVNYNKAVEWYQKAAAQNHQNALYQLGTCYQWGKGVEKDERRAFDHYLRAAQMGHADAQNTVGHFYLNGIGVENNDAAAIEWFQKSAAQNNQYGNYNMGCCYENGRGVAKDDTKAFQHYLRSAEQGYDWGQFKAGYFYANGIGVQQNGAKAVEWYEKAAAQGVDMAINNLGYCYGTGFGVKLDLQKALSLYDEAAAKGNDLARDNAAAVRRQLSEQPPAQEEIPQDTPEEMPALEQLHSMIGLESVKEEVESIIAMHRINLNKKKLGIRVPDMSLHMVFTGNPGTGKTTVARLIGKIYHELGLLENDSVKEVKRDDLVGDVIGKTALLTKAAIEDAKGGILFIDEAYTLTPEDAGRDFGQEAVTTLLAEMENHRDDLVVIVAGYTREMKRFIDSNPGLKSRFSTVIQFDDYNASDMHQIFREMVSSNGYVLEEGADALLARYFDWAVRTKTKNFGNARDVRNFYEAVMKQSSKRLSTMKDPTREDYETLQCSDIQAIMDEKMGKLDDSGDPMEALDAMIGLESVKGEVRALSDMARFYQMCVSKGMKPPARPAMHMVFAGNPGTGKTTVARLIGQIYHSLGLLPTKEVKEVKREDLVGEYIGKTALKTKEVIESALGGVLFIDEAYTLNAEGSSNDFGKEAINTLLAEMENNRENLAVIVAGYNDEMRRFISTNPGLKSRFTKYIQFDDYTGEEMVAIFRSFAKDNTFGEGAVEELSRVCHEMYEKRDKNFGNGREVRNFYDAVTSCMAARVIQHPETPAEELMQITREDILAAERKRRGNTLRKPKEANPIGF